MTDKREQSKQNLKEYYPAELDAEEAGTAHNIDFADQPQRDFQNEAPGDPITNRDLEADTTRGDSWLTYNKGPEQWGYSPSDQLTPDNIDTLEPHYIFDVDHEVVQSSPVIVPSDPPVMYVTEGDYSIHALNARTGEKFWTHQTDVTGESPLMGKQRGVAVYGDRVFMTTSEPGIVAVNRYTGEQEWQTNMLTEEQQELNQNDRVGITAAPMAYDGVVLTGQGSDYAGFTNISGVDAETGEVLWTQKTAPKDEWVGENWKFASAAAWMTPAIDPESNTMFYTVGNPNPMHNGLVRPGPNKHSNALVAMDIQSGEIQWTSQALAHGFWDYDAHSVPYVFNMRVEGEVRRVVAHEYKSAWTYIFDIETGQLLRRSEPWAKQGGDYLSLPARGQENMQDMQAWPEGSGATEWPPDTYSPDTGLRYIGGNNAAQYFYYDPSWEYQPDSDISGTAAGGGHIPIPQSQFDEFPYTTHVAALNPATGQEEWRYEYGDKGNLQAVPGGTTATGGGLVFGISPFGRIVALNDQTGEELWSDQTEAVGRTATPVVWGDPEVGKQYLAVFANDSLIVYRGG